jgi:hypothetical protein
MKIRPAVDRGDAADDCVSQPVTALRIGHLHRVEEAFARVASRREPVEGFHFGVDSPVQNGQFALYRDFPYLFRHRSEERF